MIAAVSQARALGVTIRPKATSGSTINGIAIKTRAERRGLVTTIIAAAPRNSTKLRSATEAEEPKAALIWVVSAVSRETISPTRSRSKKAGDSAITWAK